MYYMLFKKRINFESGQTLVTLLVFIVMATVVTTAATAVMINTSQASTRVEGSNLATSVAESGIENALLRLLRDPSYTGETLSVGNGSATITVSGTDPKTITSIGRINNYIKTVEVTVTYNDNIMTVTSWKEQY